MKSCCLVAFGQPLHVGEETVPVPHGDEVLVKVSAAGICHSDLHLIEGGYDAGRGKRLYASERGVQLPLTLGHEITGRPVSGALNGLDTDGDYLIYPWIGCGECAVCRAGEENLCARPRTLGIYRPGGYGEYLLVPHSRYMLPLDGLDPVAAAPYACSGLTTYSSLMKAGDALYHEAVVLFGAGGLGLMAIGLLRALGAKPPIVVDIDPAKREGALRAGAHAVVDGGAPDALQQLVDHAGGQLRTVIDFVGSEATAALGFQALAKGGKLICVGLFGGAAPWPLPLIPMRALTIQGNYVGTLAELAGLLSLVRRSGIASIPIERGSFDNVNDGLDRLRSGRVQGRLVMVPE